MVCCSRKSPKKREGCLGVPESMAGWDIKERKNTENEATNNDYFAILLWFGSNAGYQFSC